MKQIIDLSDSTKNIFLIVAGTIILLNALHIFECTLRALVIIISVSMIAVGLIRGEYIQKIRSLIKK